MRIGIIAPPWGPVPPVAYGGTEGMLDDLARGLHGLGHDVVLFTTGDSTCPVPTRWVLEHSEPCRIGETATELRHVVHAYDTLRDVDVVHDSTVIGPMYAWRYPDLPVVATNHGPFDDAFLDLYRSSGNRIALVAISRHQASTSRDVRIEAVIHHGVDPHAFPVGSGDGGYFAFLGRMTAEKGAREAALVARDAGVRLLLAAKMREPHEQQYFQEEVAPLLGDGIEYVGEIDHDTKLELLADATALINPIRWPEPFGLVMIEAMATGTPVLAFPEGAAEIVSDGETGFLCSDEQTMAACVRRVDELDRGACRSVIERHFCARRMAEDYAALFERVVAEGRAA
jgi:glycosyltransferase involved in cell wall biosynthesis